MKRVPYRRGGSTRRSLLQAFTTTTTNTATTASISTENNNNSNNINTTTSTGTGSTTPLPAQSDSIPSFQCPECFNLFFTWTKFTQHLETTQHFSARCVECRELLKCFGPTYPYRHEALTGHRGLLGTFYVREDYAIDHPPHLTLPQYRCECLVVFLTPLALAEHLRNDHRVTAISDEAVCLTCGVRGTIAEMTAHRMDKLNNKELHKFEVKGFKASRYLKASPQRPPWPQVVRSYIVLYQCPVCILLFVNWDVMQQHMTSTGHCQNILTLMNARPGHANRENSDETLSPDEFEVLVDRDDPEMRALICETLPESSSSGPNQGEDEGDRLIAFQCPEESCGRVFLTHGELFEHMETNGHYPNVQNEEEEVGEEDHLEEDNVEEKKENASEVVPAWQWNLEAYEVECSSRELVRYFGFSRCPHCRRVLSTEWEEVLVHMQIHHPNAASIPVVSSSSIQEEIEE
ncbi:ZN622/Rei1/Reh1 [Trypanosoma melophagium]|uniref:ZN622/Rei1/Reh1 n=1 Tax=Trypanosoma melophagium TaxID=715481 RepID=UPI00351A9653|nr:ZN622/Rei1/Reh1 [Trypanosoma melophagium]